MPVRRGSTSVVDTGQIACHFDAKVDTMTTRDRVIGRTVDGDAEARLLRDYQLESLSALVRRRPSDAWFSLPTGLTLRGRLVNAIYRFWPPVAVQGMRLRCSAEAMDVQVLVPYIEPWGVSARPELKWVVSLRLGDAAWRARRASAEEVRELRGDWGTRWFSHGSLSE